MKRTFYMDYALIYRRRSITLRARMQMFLAKVTAVAVYGCAAWNYSQHHLAKLESTYFQLLKRLIRIKKPWHAITYEDIIDAGKKRGLRIQPLQLYIHFYKARYLGHLARTNKSALQRKILHSEVKSHTHPARKRANHLTQQRPFLSALHNLGINTDTWEKDAQDRIPWKNRLNTAGVETFMPKWLKAREDAKEKRRQHRMKPPTRASIRLAARSQFPQDNSTAATGEFEEDGDEDIDLATTVGLLDSTRDGDDDMGDPESDDDDSVDDSAEDSDNIDDDDEDYWCGYSDHGNDKTDEADDDFAPECPISPHDDDDFDYDDYQHSKPRLGTIEFEDADDDEDDSDFDPADENSAEVSHTDDSSLETEEDRGYVSTSDDDIDSANDIECHTADEEMKIITHPTTTRPTPQPTETTLKQKRKRSKPHSNKPNPHRTKRIRIEQHNPERNI